ncbi:MAG: 1-deoxy-D-xylulose-5-phosphate synthase [Candidatus Krumholzibacteriota bacterium]|nr:1-deoxy-D-xylulose-5-phosphate synthase [Candidatus Krumholzibacteriota bacterium]
MNGTELLQSINSPQDIKGLTLEELAQLADALRRMIIETVSARGGHLASSLGAVEIVLALHYTFNSPEDKIVWDVGHQSYAHKILTGRRNQFADLRTRHGISGFPNIFESPHDTFGVGHACTAISAALGFAVARDLRGEDNFVISVVGDGAISGGIALEGINHAGHLKKNKFVIILNDNEMSISKNVGAISKYLTRISTKKLYLQLEADVWELLGKIPSLGGKARILAGRIKESIKNLVVPNLLFEELGFRYLGPLDGHDLRELINTFSHLHQVPGPVLVHVITKKGKGYPFAEKDAEKFHGIGSFYKKTGNSRSKSKKEKYSKIFGKTLSAMARDNDRIVAITAAMKEGTGLSCFAEEFPGRFFDVGISEQHAVTFAAGLAREGMIPFVAIYSTFLQRGFDQLIHDVALQKLPVRFILDRAGIVGEDGPTHHGTFDLSYLRLIPGMVLMAPANENELSRMLYTALQIDDTPSAIRFPRGTIEGVPPKDADVPLPVGRGEILREGADGVILAVGTMVNPSLQAAELLAAAGLDMTVLNARFIKPLDEELIKAFVRPGMPLFTVEENIVTGGFGDAVGKLISENELSNQIKVFGIHDHFVPHGTRDELLREEGLVAEEISRRILEKTAPGSHLDQGGGR